MLCIQRIEKYYFLLLLKVKTTENQNMHENMSAHQQSLHISINTKKFRVQYVN